MPRSGSLRIWTPYFAILAEVIDWHLKGTRYGIGADPADGLLRASSRDAVLGAWWRLEKAKQSSIGVAALPSTAR